MPYKEMEITKLYHSIGEVANMLNVSTSLLRFWDKEFDILKPRKNKKGDRLFTQKDVDNVKLIYHYVKERGFTLEGAKRKLRENRSDSVNNYQVVESLKKIRGLLLDIKENM
ncbi:MAG: MerR family transcriptional regulator [Bacteroidetes bacterium]|nr:MerR family transcriptional regulator [Bacteroidota bacterium]